MQQTTLKQQAGYVQCKTYTQYTFPQDYGCTLNISVVTKFADTVWSKLFHQHYSNQRLYSAKPKLTKICETGVSARKIHR